MSSQTVNAEGQVTLTSELLQHLSVKPGGSLASFFGVLAGKTDRVVTIDEMNDVASGGLAGADNENHH